MLTCVSGRSGLILATDGQESIGPRPLVAIPGQVFTAIPGGPCLWCAEFLTEAKLEKETEGRRRSYLQDPAGRGAFVAPFNGTLASEAAAEVLRLVSGLRSDREVRRQYDGFAGTLSEFVVVRRTVCPLCNSVLAAGDPVWRSMQVAATACDAG